MRKIILSIFAICIMAALANAESCTTVGEVSKKYTPEGECNYKTQTRTCCENKQWSEWGKECEKKAGGCWNGREYEPKPDSERHTISPNVNLAAIRNKDGSLYNKLTSGKAAIADNVTYRHESCSCSSGKGWMCNTRYTFNVVEGQWTTSQIISPDKSLTVKCDNGTTESINAGLSKYLGGRNLCGYVDEQLKPAQAFNACTKIPYTSGESLSSSYARLYGSKRRECSGWSWGKVEYEHSTWFRSEKCYVYGVALTTVWCDISEYTVYSYKLARESLFGE